MANEINLPEEPISRNEKYLATIAGQTGIELPEEPISRVEKYLAYIAENGAGGGGGEVADARTGADGTTYDSLKERLDAENSQLNKDLTDLSNKTIKYQYNLQPEESITIDLTNKIDGFAQLVIVPNSNVVAWRYYGVIFTASNFTLTPIDSGTTNLSVSLTTEGLLTITNMHGGLSRIFNIYIKNI